MCGSHLHLYEVLGPFMEPGDVLGHEAMGVIEEVGDAVTAIKPGDRVVIPFQISCGHCFMCDQQLYTQCETTQVRAYGTGAALFGYSKMYGQVPGGQVEYAAIPPGGTVVILGLGPIGDMASRIAMHHGARVIGVDLVHIMPLLGEDGPLGVESFATHRIPLAEAPQAYADFQAKTNGTVKVVMTP